MAISVFMFLTSSVSPDVRALDEANPVLFSERFALQKAERSYPQSSYSNAAFTLSYEIDRSQVPLLYYNDLTVQITVGQVENVQVTANGAPIAFEYDSEQGVVQVTTSESALELALTNPDTTTPNLGTITKSVLKDNKDFAWSIGLDDNVDLRDTVAVLDSYGWQGTLFMIASDIDDVRDEDWIIDVPFLNEKLPQGWSIGNHTWDHPCSPIINNNEITSAYDRTLEIVSQSARPGYVITSFAAPCFITEYHPVILQHRDTQLWPVQFNESGNRTPFIVDPENTDDILVEDEFNPAAYAFNYDDPVGRGQFLDSNTAQALIDKFDWIATRFEQGGEHMWHNSLVHGGKEVPVETAVSYLHDTYGPGGTDQVWVAPSDQIYSYLLVRDNSNVTLLGSNLPATATPTFTPTSTPTSTPTPTFTPTSTPTFTPTSTPTSTSTSTFTPTSTPTFTSTPTHTPIPTQTFTPTSTPTHTIVPTATSTLGPTETPVSSATAGSRIHLPLLIE